MIKVAYIGRERCDFIYYLYRAATLLHLRTIVIDNSFSGDLFTSLSGSTSGVDDRDDVLLLRNFHYEEDKIEDMGYDVCFYYTGVYKDMKLNGVFDRIYIATTQSAIVLNNTKWALENISMQGDVTVILDDITKQKLTIGAVKEFIGIFDMESEDLEFSFDDTRLFKYEVLTHSGSCTLKGNNKEFIKLMKSEIQGIFSLTDKEYKANRLEKNM